MRIITLNEDDMREPCDHNNLATCGHCHRSWCDTCTPTPSARCPYEYDHDEVFEEDDEPDGPPISDEEFEKDSPPVKLTFPLAPHGGCNWKGCRECFPHDHERDEEMLAVEAERGYDVEKLKPRMNGPCPTCGESGGFHDDAKHRNNIDPSYLKEKGWHLGSNRN